MRILVLFTFDTTYYTEATSIICKKPHLRQVRFQSAGDINCTEGRSIGPLDEESKLDVILFFCYELRFQLCVGINLGYTQSNNSNAVLLNAPRLPILFEFKVKWCQIHNFIRSTKSKVTVV